MRESKYSKRNRMLKTAQQKTPNVILPGDIGFNSTRVTSLKPMFDPYKVYKHGVFLDDERVPSDVTWVTLPKTENWHIVRTLREFRDYMEDLLETVPLDEIVVSFDYVLSTTEPRPNVTGRTCMDWLMVELGWRYENTPVAVNMHSSDRNYRNTMANSWYKNMLENYPADNA
jgi:hypothetical protein